ncbi:unnamed protein product, partial [Ectocarpus fasciculatus]
MPDRREDYIADVIAGLSSEKSTRDEVLRAVQGKKELQLFLDDPNTAVLCVRALRGGGVRLDNGLDFLDEGSERETKEGGNEDEPPAEGRVGLHFVKLRPEPVTGGNIRSLVQVSSMTGSPLNSLYHSIHSVYAPALLKNEAGRQELSGKVQSVIALLDSTLGDAVIYGGGGGISHDNNSNNGNENRKGNTSRENGDLSCFGGIVYPSDEFHFWSGYSGRAADRELVTAVVRALEPLREPFSALSGLQTEELEELMDITHTALDEVWKADGGGGARGSYPQARMAHLFDVIGAALCRHVQEKLRPLDIWAGPLSDVRTRLLEGAQVCSKWCRITEELSSSYWSGFIQHPWKGDPHVDNLTAGTAARLEEIHRLRTTREELGRLLGRGRGGGIADDSHEIFKPFREMSALSYNPYTQQEWESRVKDFEKSLQPLETAAANSFRRR